ncbi:MAG: hypothetical protein E7191_05395 [Erysipelotrichaceae bacterium]|nr:hypothetical protein [Erysipelotrichaceae bacterium]
MTMKRLFLLPFSVVILLGMLSGCSGGGTSSKQIEPELIAEALDMSSLEKEYTIKTFQDITSFFGRRFDTWNETYRNTKLVEGDQKAIIEYIDLLIHTFDYEIVDTYHFDPTASDPFNGTFLNGTWEVCLGLSSVDTGRETEGRLYDTPCDIDLYSKKGELKVWFTDLFHTEDYGYRCSTCEGDRFTEVFGQRVFDEFYMKEDRYYNSSDGALSVAAFTHGEAAILVNNEESLYTTDAVLGKEVYVDYENDDYLIIVKEFLDGVEDERIRITIPMTLQGGEVFTLSDALGNRGDSPIDVIYDPGEGSIIRSYEDPTARAAMNAFTLRVLKYDDVECVFYFAMDIVSELEPITIEGLVAVPMYGTITGNEFKKEEAITLKVGKSMKLEFDAPYVFMPNYETYEWKITSGQGVSINGNGDTSTVTAVSPGQVVIKCVYSYGTDEADVLTGIPRNEDHTKTKLYYIEVVEK